MKKIEYMAPEMEVIKLKMVNSLLQASNGTEEGDGDMNNGETF
jgi:hypothetical protein